MPLITRPSAARGHADHGWLESYHSFSFAGYFDPAHTGFGVLRVINEDRVAGGAGFDTHDHRDMEIISYVLSGELAHRDSMGHGAVIRPSDVQVMSAGTGIRHSEFNNSADAEVHFLQIWITPSKMGVAPRYDQTQFDADARRNRLCLIVSADGRDGSLMIHQDAQIFASRLDEGRTVSHAIQGRRSWLQVINGSVEALGQKLSRGDGAAIEREDVVALRALQDSHILLFDLP
jgi:redox-sensitive bicupin YhaK (pirin superfamily)